MRTVRTTAICDASVHEAMTAWCDTDRWHLWVEGLDRIVSVTEAWPGTGGIVRWQSGPAGRGDVTERILAYEPLAAIESEIEDDQVLARQHVQFAPLGDDQTEITLDFGYRITRRTPITPVIDWLFVRPAMSSSLQTTLGRFAANASSTRGAATS